MPWFLLQKLFSWYPSKHSMPRMTWFVVLSRNLLRMKGDAIYIYIKTTGLTQYYYPSFSRYWSFALCLLVLSLRTKNLLLKSRLVGWVEVTTKRYPRHGLPYLRTLSSALLSGLLLSAESESPTPFPEEWVWPRPKISTRFTLRK